MLYNTFPLRPVYVKAIAVSSQFTTRGSFFAAAAASIAQLIHEKCVMTCAKSGCCGRRFGSLCLAPLLGPLSQVLCLGAQKWGQKKGQQRGPAMTFFFVVRILLR